MTAAQNTAAAPVFHQAEAAPGRNRERCHCRNTITLPSRTKEHHITASCIRHSTPIVTGYNLNLPRRQLAETTSDKPTPMTAGSRHTTHIESVALTSERTARPQSAVAEVLISRSSGRCSALGERQSAMQPLLRRRRRQIFFVRSSPQSLQCADWPRSRSTTLEMCIKPTFDNTAMLLDRLHL